MIDRRLLSPLCALALAVALGWPSCAIAAPAPSAGAVAEKRAQAAQAQEQMRRMQAKLATGMREYAKVSGQLATVQREIGSSNKRLGVLETRLKAIGSRLDDRATYLYRTRDIGPLDVLFSAASFEQFLERFDILSRIAVEDAALILEAKHARTEEQQLRVALRDRESRLLSLRKKAAEHRDALAADVSQQHSYFSSLSADVTALLAQQERESRPKPVASSGGSPAPSGSSAGRSPKAGSGLALAKVEGRSGRYYVMAGEPKHYRPGGIAGTTEASTYSVSDNGGTGTSSGEPLDDNALTCACSPSLGLSFGTRVALVRGGRRVIVVVTDRGPFSPPGRDFDLTPRAASLLGLDGVGDVHYEVVEDAS